MTHSGFGCGFQCPACDGAENPRFPKEFPRFPFHAKLFQTFSLTLSTVHPSLSSDMKTASFPPLPTTTDWAKLNSIQSSLRNQRSVLDSLSSRPDGFGIDQMSERLDRYQSFVNDRKGPFGFLFRWFQTGR